MEFFDKKQDVIDLQITQFGRLLMSKGRFKPEYYAFFDDNILYNSFKVDLNEEQNASEERIKTTQVLQPQVCYSPLEKEFNSTYNQVLSGELSAISENFQRTPEKNYLLPHPIGTSKLNSEYAPAWGIRFLNGGLTDAAESLELKDISGTGHTLLIPQVNTHLELKVIHSENELVDFDEDTAIFSGYSITSPEEERFILLKILEENGYFQKKNFDVEMYEVQETTIEGITTETLRPLYFEPPINITNTSDPFDPDVSPPIPDTSFVDYYFDILFDDNISDEILCTYDPVNEKMGVFADKRTKLCQDVLEEEADKTFNIYEDKDYPGEIC